MPAGEYILFEGDQFTIEWYYKSNGKSQALTYFGRLDRTKKIKFIRLVEIMGTIGVIRVPNKKRCHGFVRGRFSSQPNPYNVHARHLQPGEEEQMTKPLVSDALWEKGHPLLPVPKPRRFRFPGRKRIDDRKALTGILFVLKSGIPWEQLPQEMGWDSGMTCWHRLKAWHEAGVWERLHHLLLSKLRAVDGLDGSRACVDSASLRAVGAGGKTRPQSHRPPQARA